MGTEFTLTEAATTSTGGGATTTGTPRRPRSRLRAGALALLMALTLLVGAAGAGIGHQGGGLGVQEAAAGGTWYGPTGSCAYARDRGTWYWNTVAGWVCYEDYGIDGKFGTYVSLRPAKMVWTGWGGESKVWTWVGYWKRTS